MFIENEKLKEALFDMWYDSDKLKILSWFQITLKKK